MYLECVIANSFLDSPNNFKRIVEDTSGFFEPTFTRPKAMATSDEISMLSEKIFPLIFLFYNNLKEIELYITRIFIF